MPFHLFFFIIEYGSYFLKRFNINYSITFKFYLQCTQSNFLFYTSQRYGSPGSRTSIRSWYLLRLILHTAFHRLFIDFPPVFLRFLVYIYCMIDPSVSMATFSFDIYSTCVSFHYCHDWLIFQLHAIHDESICFTYGLFFRVFQRVGIPGGFSVLFLLLLLVPFQPTFWQTVFCRLLFLTFLPILLEDNILYGGKSLVNSLWIYFFFSLALRLASGCYILDSNLVFF